MNYRPEIHSDADAVARAAADRIVAISAASDKTRPLAIALCGGSTPLLLYRLLASPGYADRVPWDRIHWFWGDERMVPADHPDSNQSMVREAMLSHVPAPAENIHPVPTHLGDAEKTARRYEDDLTIFYGSHHLVPDRPLFDLMLLGIGDDGHTASLFPGKPALDETKRWVVGVKEAGMRPFVPRVSLTYPALASSREVIFLAVGSGKRKVLARVGGGEDLPAARVTSMGAVRWLVDQAAAGA